MKKDIKKTVKIIRNEEFLKNGLIYGVVYSPDEVDSYDDYTSADVIRKAAHEFLPWGGININHADNRPSVSVVESFLAPTDFKYTEDGDEVTKGSWVLVVKVYDDDLKQRVIDGNIEGYSLEGWGEIIDKPFAG